jgi:hypothetical protein
MRVVQHDWQRHATVLRGTSTSLAPRQIRAAGSGEALLPVTKTDQGGGKRRGIIARDKSRPLECAMADHLDETVRAATKLMRRQLATSDQFSALDF